MNANIKSVNIQKNGNSKIAASHIHQQKEMNKNVQNHVKDVNTFMLNWKQRFVVLIADNDVSNSIYFEPILVVGVPRTDKTTNIESILNMINSVDGNKSFFLFVFQPSI